VPRKGGNRLGRRPGKGRSGTKSENSFEDHRDCPPRNTPDRRQNLFFRTDYLSYGNRQAVHGRVFQTLDEVREAVGNFIRQYHEQWRVEKIAPMTPREARDQWSSYMAA